MSEHFSPVRLVSSDHTQPAPRRLIDVSVIHNPDRAAEKRLFTGCEATEPEAERLSQQDTADTHTVPVALRRRGPSASRAALAHRVCVAVAAPTRSSAARRVSAQCSPPSRGDHRRQTAPFQVARRGYTNATGPSKNGEPARMGAYISAFERSIAHLEDPARGLRGQASPDDPARDSCSAERHRRVFSGVRLVEAVRAVF